MKNVVIFAFAFWLTNAFGQTPTNKTNEVVAKYNAALQNDTSLIVAVMIGPGTLAHKTAYYLNDQFIDYSLLVSINPKLMESLTLVDIPFEIDRIKYEKQIRLIAKNHYSPKAISLDSLKNKCFPGELKNEPVIFMIDDKIIHGDYVKYEVDENNLYAVVLESPYERDKIKIYFLKLTTKSEASIKNYNATNIWMTGDGGVTIMK